MAVSCYIHSSLILPIFLPLSYTNNTLYSYENRLSNAVLKYIPQDFKLIPFFFSVGVVLLTYNLIFEDHVGKILNIIRTDSAVFWQLPQAATKWDEVSIKKLRLYPNE